MEPVPWRRIKSWNCITCGICCKEFDVVLGYQEWANIIRNFGVGAIKPSVTRLCLGKKGDGTCVFLYNSSGLWLCGLQLNKPKACKLWPFKVFNNLGIAEIVKPFIGMETEIFSFMLTHPVSD